MKVLNHDFYNRDPLLVAQELLGKVLVRKYEDRIISGRIIETEAYLGLSDEASHSFIGQTKRNAVLFGAAGHAYIHSMHMQNCLDVVTQDIGIPSSVLIRALSPIEGIDLMKSFRHKELIKDLTSGPGKLCQALNISKEFYGVDMVDKSSMLYIIDDAFIVDINKVDKTKRVGLSKGKDSEFRFLMK